MQIILNGQTIETQQTSLDGLLTEQGYTDMSIATAMNDNFIPQAERAEVLLQEHCVIEVVAPMQGG
jgi:sulfur carrier protein